MGQSMSCGSTREHVFLEAVRAGEAKLVGAELSRDAALLRSATPYHRLSALHLAAANGHAQVLEMILDRSVQPDVLNRHKQTPLMLAAMHGRLDCVRKLLLAGANVLMFDSLHGRTCLHYAAYYGHQDCLQAILSAARSGHVSESWGYARFVNVKDDKGATPLHLAARQRRADCVHALLGNGALVSASTGNYVCPGSTPLHLAARGGSLDCIRALLAWGADRVERDSTGRIPYSVALKRRHRACAALLNPSSAEPLVWPSPLKFISELDPEAKALLEGALMEANMEREKNILKGTKFALSSPQRCDDDGDDVISSEDEAELCCICFDRPCTIEVRSCSHQMCAPCVLALCCHNKPNPTTLVMPAPVCPFCRSSISQLVVVETGCGDEEEEEEEEEMAAAKPRRSSRLRKKLNEGGSSSFKSLSSAMGSFGKLGRGSGRASDGSEMLDKP